MLKHIVMWKLKNFAEDASKDENARKIRAELEGLKDKIEVIRSLEVIVNISASADSYDVVLYSEFDNAKDLSLYLNYPEHIRVGDFVGRVRLDRKVVDYEV